MMANAAGLSTRAAVPADALCLGVLATQVFLDTYATEGIRPAIAAEVLRAFSTAAFAELLARPQTRVIVAESAAHLIGFAQLTLGAAHAQVLTDAPAELDRLYVQEPFTGLGIGSRLLQEVEALAAAAGISDLWLTPWVHNLRALGFYAGHGYADFGATVFELDGERHVNRVLAKHIA
jgi:GNAT superfamily N-acetyltransferase